MFVLAGLLALDCACATAHGSGAGHHSLPTPARLGRAGSSPRGAGPEQVSPRAQGRVPPREAGSYDPAVTAAVATAAGLVGKRRITVDGTDYGADCAALVRASFDAARAPLPRSAITPAGLYDYAQGQGALKKGLRPSPGDVLFLADREGGAPAHVGLVGKVEPDGTALVYHRVARGVMKMRVNLAFPARQQDPSTGRVVNDALVVEGEGPKPAGILVVGFAGLLP